MRLCGASAWRSCSTAAARHGATGRWLVAEQALWPASKPQRRGRWRTARWPGQPRLGAVDEDRLYDATASRKVTPSQGPVLMVVRTQTSGEFARGFGVRDCENLLQTGKANQTRLTTATEFARADSDGTLIRHPLYATRRATATGGLTESLTGLRTELPNYHGPVCESAAAVLRYLATMDMQHWREDAGAAKLVAGAVENDHV